MFNDYSYLFEQFKHREVNLADKQDPVVAEMEEVAKKNGLTLAFNKQGDFESSGGACVMPPDNQVNVTLTRGADEKWRVRRAR